MAFKRTRIPPSSPDSVALTSDLISIGMLFSGHAKKEANIENTIVFASAEGMDKEDFRVLSVLCTWLDIHSNWLNADRLVDLVAAHSSQRVKLFWAAFAHWKQKDKRFARLGNAHRGPRIPLLTEGHQFQVARFGEDPRFAGGPLIVDAKLLRNRGIDVLTPSQLARKHSVYRWRLTIGPTYRADLWATLEREPSIAVAKLARRAYSSIGAAWNAKYDHGLLQAQ
jgi:hypothetical protein